MGDIIGQGGGPTTWAQLRNIVSNGGSVTFGSHNTIYPSGTGWFKTVEGNGLLRSRLTASSPELFFTENTAPVEDYFAFFGMADPYPEQLVGSTVTTSSSSFTIIADAFTIGQQAGLNGTSPITSVQSFINLP
jgi:hypothetical protein